MSRLRSLASQSPAIIISVVALAFSLGSGAGYAASTTASHPAAAAKVTWHKLSLRNGWKPGPAAFDTAAPKYKVSGGVVYLTGVAVYAPNTGTATPPAVVGVLPKAERPTHNLWLGIFNYAASGSADLEIATNGQVKVIGGPDAAYFTSLAGVSFPLGS